MNLEKRDYIFISKWLIYWMAVLGFYLIVLTQKQITYLSSSITISCYYVIFSLIGISLFSKKYQFKKILYIALLILIGVVLGEGLNHLVMPLTEIQVKSFYEFHFYYPLLKIPSSFSKLFEILFQQTMVYLLVDYLYQRSSVIKETMNYFTLVFVILHIPLLFIFSFLGLVFIIPSILAGYIFSYLILKYEQGYLLSYSIHFFFYIAMTIFVRYSGLSAYDLL